MSHKQFKRTKCCFILASIGAVGVTACDAAPKGVDLDSPKLSIEERRIGAEDQQADDVLPAQQMLVKAGEYSWHQGEAEVPLGTTTGRVCFLTHIQGRFEGGGEYVHVRAANGSWWLGGGSLQQGVGVRARCIYADYSDEYYWTQGQLPKYMVPSAGHTCFLTSVSGNFEGGGEYVYAYDSGNGWYLGGNSLQQGVTASARCVPHSSSEYSWSQGMASVIMDDLKKNACFLNQMVGRFHGGSESITIFAGGTNWYLGGTSQQVAVGASARCI